MEVRVHVQRARAAVREVILGAGPDDPLSMTQPVGGEESVRILRELEAADEGLHGSARGRIPGAVFLAAIRAAGCALFAFLPFSSNM